LHQADPEIGPPGALAIQKRGAAKIAILARHVGLDTERFGMLTNLNLPIWLAIPWIG